jgi:hypothetical protein
MYLPQRHFAGAVSERLVCFNLLLKCQKTTVSANVCIRSLPLIYSQGSTHQTLQNVPLQLWFVIVLGSI